MHSVFSCCHFANVLVSSVALLLSAACRALASFAELHFFANFRSFFLVILLAAFRCFFALLLFCFDWLCDFCQQALRVHGWLICTVWLECRRSSVYAYAPKCCKCALQARFVTRSQRSRRLFFSTLQMFSFILNLRAA